MSISSQLAAAHVQGWSKRLANSRLPYMGKWPKYLFRHDPIQNTARILQTSTILSRNHSEGVRPLDVAEREIIQNNLAVHDSVRMYFRPRTPTQFQIEGIRKPEEYYNGNAHAPTLCMMIFDAEQVLTTPGVRFSSSNMQRAGVKVGDDDAFFRQEIDFEKVYHSDYLSGENRHEIIGARCAEVLIPSPFDITRALKYIYCRSEAEKEFLMFSTGEVASAWRPKLLVSDDLKVFEKRFTFVDTVSITNNGVVVRMVPRSDRHQINVQVTAENLRTKRLVVNYPRSQMSAVPQDASAWRFPGDITQGLHFVSIYIEDCLAFRGVLNYSENPF